MNKYLELAIYLCLVTYYSSIIVFQNYQMRESNLLFQSISGIAMENSEQLLSEWRQPLITDVYVVDKNKTCKNHQGGFDLLTKVWGGFRYQFIEEDIEENTVTEPEKCDGRCEILSFLKPFPAMQQNIFYGKRICAQP